VRRILESARAANDERLVELCERYLQV